MRFAVISDIHSNLEALTEVLRAVEAQKVDRVVSLGDIVGYGASPNECCRLVRNVAEVTLLGNHDAAVAGRMDYSYYYDAARQALDLHARQLSLSSPGRGKGWLPLPSAGGPARSAAQAWHGAVSTGRSAR